MYVAYLYPLRQKRTDVLVILRRLAELGEIQVARSDTDGERALNRASGIAIWGLLHRFQSRDTIAP